MDELEDVQVFQHKPELVDRMCRTCLSSSLDLKDIFSEYSYVPDIVASFSAVKIELEDDLPQLICQECVDIITQIYRFRRQVETVDAQLRGFQLDENEPILEGLDLTLMDEEGLDVNSDMIAFDMDPIEEVVEEPESLPKGKFACQICGESFPNSTLLRKHRESNRTCDLSDSKATFLKCSVCLEGFENEEDLELHGTVHQIKDDVFQCAKCKKFCPNIKSLKRHIKTHFSSKPFKCRHCQMTFSETASLTRHYKRHLNVVEPKRFKCATCSREFGEKYSLVVHLRKHTNEKPFVCDDCGHAFADKRLLKSHFLTHLETKGHKCDVCGSEFTHRSTLVTHMRVHTNSRPYSCPHCPKSFKQATHLKIHVRSHTNVKPYSCNLCPFRTASATSLTNHKRTHSGQKPFQCPICLQNFATRDLRAHIATHTGLKDFVCEFEGCGKTFATVGQKNTHEKIKHRSPAVFACTERGCERVCASKVGLRKHLKTHQKGVKVELKEES